METEELKAIGMGHQEAVSSINVSSDGMHVASVSDDKTARVWDIHGAEVGKSSTTGYPFSVAFFPDNHHLVVGSQDGSVTIVNWRDGSLFEVLRINTSIHFEIGVLSMSRKIISAGTDKKLIVWSKQRPEEDSSPQTKLSYSMKMIIADHKVCAGPCPVLLANNVRVTLRQSKVQTTKGG